MTEDDWNTSQEPLPLLLWLLQQGKLSDRTARLFAAACCRRITKLLFKARSAYRAVVLAERMADSETITDNLLQLSESLWYEGFRWIDGFKKEKENNVIFHAANAAFCAIQCKATEEDFHLLFRHGRPRVLSAAENAAWAAAHWQRKHDGDAVKHEAYLRQLREQVPLVHDIFGNPFRSPPVIGRSVLAWNNGTVHRLAEAAYVERETTSGNLDNTRLSILSDALEEAGFTDAEILRHLRQQGTVHVRGCFALDLLLGKE
jgi:hypothetical protein